MDPATAAKATKAKSATATDAKSAKAAKTSSSDLSGPHPATAAKPAMAAAKTEALHSGQYAGKSLTEGGREQLASDQFQAKGYDPDTASKMAQAACT